MLMHKLQKNIKIKTVNTSKNKRLGWGLAYKYNII